MPSVLIVTEDRLGEMLGGAAIRAYEMARSLTDVAEVTLAGPGTEPPGLAPALHVPFEPSDPRPLRELFANADVVIMRPPNPVVRAWLRASKARIVFDICDPLPLDILEAQASSTREQQLLGTRSRSTISWPRSTPATTSSAAAGASATSTPARCSLRA